MTMVTAAILAGGLGTRLRPALEKTPKVLAPVGKRPFVAFLLDRLESAGIEKVVLLTGYRAAHIRRTLGPRYGAMTLEYSVEAMPLGTAGALRNALPKLETETVLLLNGDSYCNVDLQMLMAEHERRRADMSLTLAHVLDAGRFGQIEMNADGRLARFAEKQESGASGWINAGIYVLARSLVDQIPLGRAVSLEQDLLPDWVQRRRLFGFSCAGRFIDIGTPDSYAAASSFFSPTSKTAAPMSTERAARLKGTSGKRRRYALS